MNNETKNSVFIFGGECPFRFWQRIFYQNQNLGSYNKHCAQVDIIDLKGPVLHFDKEIVFKDEYDFRANQEGNDYSNKADTLGVLTGKFSATDSLKLYL